MKAARTVLRGRGGGNAALLPDVVRVDAERAQGWSDDEVLRRWTKLYTGPELVQQYLRDGGAGMVEAQIEAVQGWAATYRARLGDLSSYMRVLNESISRMANAAHSATPTLLERRPPPR